MKKNSLVSIRLEILLRLFACENCSGPSRNGALRSENTFLLYENNLTKKLTCILSDFLFSCVEHKMIFTYNVILSCRKLNCHYVFGCNCDESPKPETFLKRATELLKCVQWFHMQSIQIISQGHYLFSYRTRYTLIKQE